MNIELEHQFTPCYQSNIYSINQLPLTAKEQEFVLMIPLSTNSRIWSLCTFSIVDKKAQLDWNLAPLREYNAYDIPP